MSSSTSWKTTISVTSVRVRAMAVRPKFAASRYDGCAPRAPPRAAAAAAVAVARRRVAGPARPSPAQSNPALRDVGPRRRIVPRGGDAGPAALASRLPRTENLDVEVAYVTGAPTRCTVAYGLPTGSAAARLGVD